MSEENKDRIAINTEEVSYNGNTEPHTPGGHIADNSQPTMPQGYHRKYGNPAPLGLLAYGTVFLCSSLFTLQARGIQTPNLVLVFALFYGGISQILVGMWEMFLGNTFGATVFTTYAGFNFSYGALYLPEIGLAAAYTVDGVVSDEFTQAVGIYMAIWDVITLLFLIGCLRTSWPVIFTFGTTVVALTCLSANCFTGIQVLATIGGWFGLGAAGGAYYAALAGFYSDEVTFKSIKLPPFSVAYQSV